jgi:NitT/TauT family transport system permease protein
MNRTLLGLRASVLVAAVALWEYLPSVPSISDRTFINYFFISSPSRMVQELWTITLGSEAGFLFPYMARTIVASLFGLLVGVLVGYSVGVLLSESRLLDQTLRPYIMFINNVPRILVIPIIIIVFGFGQVSEVISSSIVVFFVIFFNSYQGGRLIDPAVVSFCKVLGASRKDILMNVRVYNSLLWTVAQLPNAAAFGLLGTITAEVLGTGSGVGYLIVIDLSEFNTTQMFALILVTAVYGFILITITQYLVGFLLRWNREIS